MNASDIITNRQKTQDVNLKTALNLASIGIATFPAMPNKRPYIKNWQRKATTDQNKIRGWYEELPDAIPAIPTGKKNNIAVLDIDINLEKEKNGFEGLRNMGIEPNDISCFFVTTPSGGKHIYFEWPEGMGNSSAGLPSGVDVRGEGGYVISAGAVSENGLYDCPEFISIFSLVGLTQWPQNLPPTRKSKPTTTENTTTLDDFDVVADALMAIPNDETNPDADSREYWVGIGAALHHASNGHQDGLDAFHIWSAQWHGYISEDTINTWNSFKISHQSPRTANSIFSEAKKYGWVEVDLSLYNDIDSDYIPQEEITRIEEILGSTIKIKNGVNLLSPTDCEHMPIIPYIVKGLIGEGQIGAIIGSPGAGKSLIAPFMGYLVSQGKPVFEMSTKQSTVFYVAAEDSYGMARRVAALKEKHEDSNSFFVVDDVSDLFSKNSSDLKRLIISVKQEKPKLIIIDTLAIAFPGLEENTSESMGRVIAVLRQLAKNGASVIIIHHDAKKKDGLPRGHSSLNGALDFSIYLKRDKNIVTGSLTKNRNGTTEMELTFEVDTVNMGMDEDSEPITTAICSVVDAASLPVDKTKLGSCAQVALNILEDIMLERDSVPIGDWRSPVIADDTIFNTDVIASRIKSFSRAVKSLMEARLIIKKDKEYCLARVDDWDDD